MHKNIERVNNLWRSLFYFSVNFYIERISKSLQGLKKGSSTQEVFNKYFYSAEGYYSQAAFNDTALSFKIIGLGHDDYDLNPVVLTESGSLLRTDWDRIEELLLSVQDYTLSPAIDRSNDTKVSKYFISVVFYHYYQVNIPVGSTSLRVPTCL